MFILTLNTIVCPKLHIYLPPVTEGRGWEIIKCLLYVRACICPSIRHVFTLTLISHLFIKISSPNLQGKFMAMKTGLYKILVSF